MSITITEYSELNNLSFGLGQDVSQDLKELVKVASIFVKGSKIHNLLLNSRLDKVVTDVNIREELKATLNASLISPTWKQLTGTRTKGEANSLVQAIFPGQSSRLAIVDWAAQNYVSVTVAFGLLDFHRATKTFTISDLGRQAVSLYESGDIKKLEEFLFERLLEYPYASWLIRLLGNNPGKQFSKFDLGENFGFIDELGFETVPVEIYLNDLAQAELDNNNEAKRKIKSNFESTSNKYMRWLAGVLVTAGLASATTKRVSHEYKGHVFDITIGTVYQITTKGLTALKQVNGKSRYSRSKKRVMWEFLATKDKNAIAKKTSRSLMLKYLAERKNPLKAEKIADLINKDFPALRITPEEVIDDCKGLNRIGIEIIISQNNLSLKEELYPFEIPIRRGTVLEKNDVEKLKDGLRSELKHINHSYLKGIDIAFKNRTSNSENIEFEAISTKLFIDELGFSGKHLGGSSKPDGLLWDDSCVIILDSKAYSQGFTLTASHTDAMGRYLRQFKERNKDIKPTWWDIAPEKFKNIFFTYVSGKFAGDYHNQLKKFVRDTGVKGGALEFIKLLLLADNYKGNKMNRKEIIESILDDNISYDDYYSRLIQVK